MLAVNGMPVIMSDRFSDRVTYRTNVALYLRS
jgi:hypothetical protein